MVAVTIGVGKYARMAAYAAVAIARQTGLLTHILGDREFSQSGLSKPHLLKLRLFDLIAEDDLLYFDADMVCLRTWDPTAFAGGPALVAVRERQVGIVRKDAKDWGIGAEDYFNSGLFVANRKHHAQWLKLAETLLSSGKKSRFIDQTVLNSARDRLSLPLCLINRSYNWIGFGEGSLCYRVPVYMAHSILPDPSHATNCDYFEHRYSPPLISDIRIDEAATDAIKGKTFVRITTAGHRKRLTLREDGTVLPVAGYNREGYWFVRDVGSQHHLVLATDRHLSGEYRSGPSGSWVGPDLLLPDGLARDTSFGENGGNSPYD